MLGLWLKTTPINYWSAAHVLDCWSGRCSFYLLCIPSLTCYTPCGYVALFLSSVGNTPKLWSENLSTPRVFAGCACSAAVVTHLVIPCRSPSQWAAGGSYSSAAQQTEQLCFLLVVDFWCSSCYKFMREIMPSSVYPRAQCPWEGSVAFHTWQDWWVSLLPLELSCSSSHQLPTSQGCFTWAVGSP